MLNSPLFTIVTPSFNQGSFLPATLDSIQNQKFQDFEHLIYDPGSTDGSLDTIRAYCDRLPQAELILGQDKSQTHAINLGYGRAKGDILCWLNSDDTYYDDTVLGTVAQAFADNPDVDVIYGKGQFIAPDGKVIREAYINRDGSNIARQMATSLGILQPSLFMRRRVFDLAGALDEGMNFSFDYEYWARCAHRGARFHFIDRHLSRAVIHEDAKTMRARGTSLEESLSVAQRYYGFVAFDWVQRLADYQVNQNDGLINTAADEVAMAAETRDLFRQNNAKGVALSRYFNADPLMDDKTRTAFDQMGEDLFSRVYLSGWDKNYFDMGMTLIASIHRNDPDTFIFVYDLGMSKDQLAVLRSLHQVILLERDFVPFQHGWQRHPKNYVFKITLFRHLMRYLPEGCALLWIDAGVMLMQESSELFDQLCRDGVFFMDHDDSRHWPLFNASFTSDAAVKAGRFTWAELAGPHVCSALFGAMIGHSASAVFDEAAKMAAVHEIAVGDKHPPEAEKRAALDKQALRGKAEECARRKEPVEDIEQLRGLFGYYGHRQDQSIISLLAARYGLPVSSAAKFSPANDESSKISKENWFEGVSSNLGDYAPVPEEQSGITFHHRGLVKEFRGLRFAHEKAPVAGILGNGPSLAEIDLTALKDVDGFGMNAAYRFWEQEGWYPSFYCCLDTVVGMSHKEAIRDLVRNRHRLGMKGFLLRQNLVEWLAETDDLDGVVNFDLIRFGVQSFLAEPVTTGSHSLAWSNWLGYRCAFVAGVDCNYVEKVQGAETTQEGTLKIKARAENPNYFFNGYQQVGDAYNVPNPSKDLHIRSWRNVAQLLDPDLLVLNVSAVSRMDAFEKSSLQGALKRFAQHNEVFAEGPVSVQHDILMRVIREGLHGNESRFLSFLSASLMLAPKAMTTLIQRNHELRQARTQALDALPETDKSKEHFRKVETFANSASPAAETT